LVIRTGKTTLVAIGRDDAFFAEYLDRVEMGIVLFNHQSKVSYCNKIAKSVIRQSPAITMRQGVIHAVSIESNKKMRAAIAAAVSENKRAAVGLMHPEVFPSLPVLITPVRQSKFSEDIASSHSVAVVMSIAPPERTLTALLKDLKNVYGLTSKEADVAIRMANAKTAAEIARDRHVTESTVNTQMQAVYSKLGVRTQCKVMRMLFFSSVTSIK